MRNFFSLFRFFILWVWVSFGAAIAHAEPLRINTGVGVPYVQEDGKGFLQLLLGEAFRRVGLQAEVQRLPSSERSLLNSNGGLDDGEALRVKGLEAQYPNLIRVDEKLLDNDFVAYTLGKSFMTSGWDSLRSYEIGYISGWKVFESNLGASYRVTLAQDATQLFGLLRNQRVDIVLFERWQGNAVLKSSGIRAKVLNPRLASTEMFMYVHKKHAALVEPLARALRTMKVDGTYRRYWQQALAPMELSNE